MLLPWLFVHRTDVVDQVGLGVPGEYFEDLEETQGSFNLIKINGNVLSSPGGAAMQSRLSLCRWLGE